MEIEKENYTTLYLIAGLVASLLLVTMFVSYRSMTQGGYSFGETISSKKLIWSLLIVGVLIVLVTVGTNVLLSNEVTKGAAKWHESYETQTPYQGNKTVVKAKMPGSSSDTPNAVVYSTGTPTAPTGGAGGAFLTGYEDKSGGLGIIQNKIIQPTYLGVNTPHVPGNDTSAIGVHKAPAGDPTGFTL